MTLWSPIVPYVILIDFPKVVTLLKATLPIHTSSITMCQFLELSLPHQRRVLEKNNRAEGEIKNSLGGFIRGFNPAFLSVSL